MRPHIFQARRAACLLLVLAVPAVSGCTPSGAPLSAAASDGTARGGAPTVTEDNAATAAPAAASIGGTRPIPSGR